MANPIAPSTYTGKLTEKTLLSFQLEPPILKRGDQSYMTRTSGSVPFDPECLYVIDAETFKSRFNKEEGSEAVVSNALPPIDWRNPIFSEDDNRYDLKNKVYLPLSRALKHSHDMCFSHDCGGNIPAGVQDTTVVSVGELETRVIFEEKSESLMEYLLDSVGKTFPQICRSGREAFIKGRPMRTNTARFSFPLVLAQTLGYMAAEATAYGVIITSGRAYFVWVEVGEEQDNSREPPPKKSKGGKKKAVSNDARTTSGIYLTDAIKIDDPEFLRVMYNFILQTKESRVMDMGLTAAELLRTPSSSGGLTRGESQDNKPQTRNRSPSTKLSPRSSGGGVVPFPGAKMSMICRFPCLPRLNETCVIADTLGRNREGRVAETKWNGVSAALKVVRLGNDEHEETYVRRVFEGEVKAYEMAGLAGLWGLAVPQPFFVATDDKYCALCLALGDPMPTDSDQWSRSELIQAAESVRLLYEAGIELSDIKPANFIRIPKQEIGASQNTEEQRVVAIDLEESFLEAEAESLELPEWMFQEAEANTVSP